MKEKNAELKVAWHASHLQLSGQMTRVRAFWFSSAKDLSTKLDFKFWKYQSR